MSTLLRFELEDADAVAREYATNLRFGRLLVPVVVDAEPLSQARVELVRISDGRTLTLEARILMLLPDGPSRGTAVELIPSDDQNQRIERFVHGGHGDEVQAISEPACDPRTMALGDPMAGAAEEMDLPLLDDLPSLDAPSLGEVDPPEASSHDPKIVRIRKMGATERARLARTGHLEDRVLLERVYGKDVWEELLRNPQLTVPEVARIAAKGTVPRIMLESIVDNQSWSRQPIVRRALLANPRLSIDAVNKLLRATPKNELKSIVQGTAYPIAVRGIAKKLLAE